jgi:hypothetical protein
MQYGRCPEVGVAKHRGIEAVRSMQPGRLFRVLTLRIAS